MALDPYLWLEEVESDRAIDWVGGQNQRTVSELTKSPLYAPLFEDAEAILLAKDRVPFSSFGRGHFWNFWQDEAHQHGLLRRTTYDEYLREQPRWEVVLDLDELSARENENWVYQGGARLRPGSSRRLLRLSRGGKDAAVVREYDADAKTFVTDGFNLPEAKSKVAAIDLDTLLVATDEGPDSMTTSGYPRVLKIWKRGQPFAAAPTIFSGAPTDMAVSPFTIDHGADKYVGVHRALTFYESETYLLDATGRPRRLEIPRSASLIDLRRGRAYVHLREPLTAGDRTFGAGSVVTMDPFDPQTLELVFAPRHDQSIESVHVASDRVILSLIEDVRGRLVEVKRTDAEWTARPIVFAGLGLGLLNYTAADEDDASSFAMLTYSDHLTPPTQYRVFEDDGAYRLEKLKSAPARFDATAMDVTQHFAVSRDGTKVPYFVLKKKGLALDGKNPTVLYGYGGFEISLTPSYSGVIGKMWLERGGVYVIANIRGGGEYGPDWHQAALKHNRQRAFDDFTAVAEDLMVRRVTSPRHLGIQGGSNGGLLTGTTMVQRPDLFAAALIQVPLLDMVRFSKLLAGASWMGEYGDPEIPEDLAAILKYSPYQNVRADRTYPTPLFTTSTKDDRVHPGHARKMAARMIEQGHPVWYFENLNGGHAGSANLSESVRMEALEWTYLWERLK